MKATSAFLSIAALAAAGGAFFLLTRGSGGAAPRQGDPSMPAPAIHNITVTRIPERVIPDGGGPAGFEVSIDGANFFGTAFGPFVRFNGADAAAVIIDSQTHITAYGAPALRGAVEVIVENPDRQAAKATAEFK